MAQSPAARVSGDLGRYGAVAAVLAGLVLVQAGLAGQFLNGGSGALGPHRLIGEGLGVVAVALMAEGYRIRSSIRGRRWLAAVPATLVVAQTGLGFAGRSSTVAGSLHVSVGVATFGLAQIAAAPSARR